MNTVVLDLKSNSFNFLRLVLAVSVLIGHSFELGGFGFDPVFYFSQSIYSIGALAVDCFFAISGLLITMSYKKINSVIIFLWHRFLRIFPGYWLCIVLSSILLHWYFLDKFDLSYAKQNILGPTLSAFQSMVGFLLPLILGWTPDLGNLSQKIPLFEQGYIPGIFGNESVNGSLWSLYHEFRLYCLIALLGATGLLKKWVILSIAIFSWILYFYCIYKDPSWNGLAGASTYRTTAHFFMGAIFYFTRNTLGHAWAFVAVVLALITLRLGIYPLISPLTTAYCVFYLAAVVPFYNFGSSNDFSYGVYVYAFPIQKTLTAISLNQFGVFYYFLMSLFLTFIFASISWFLIEKKAIRLKYISGSTIRAKFKSISEFSFIRSYKYALVLLRK
ncbi:acyltransferase family protein [Methylomonas sp. MgM2]